MPMNHDQAIREQAVERYLLGELTGEGREQFEDHFFDCEICAADLKSGALFVDALRNPELAASPRRPMHLIAKRAPLAWLRPSWLAPALAASLLVIAYQNIHVLPGMRQTA